MKTQESIEFKKNVHGYYCSPSAFALKHLIYPLGMGHITDNPNFLISRNYFPGYLVVYCLSGQFHLYQYGIFTTLSSGQSCLLSLKDFHRYYSDSKNSCNILWIHFDGNHVSDLVFEIFQQQQKYIVINEPQIAHLIQNCLEQFTSKQSRSMPVISANIYQILICFLDNTSWFQEYDVMSPLEKQVYEYVIEHIGKKITLEILANHCCLNPSYFCRRFRSETNVTPMQYLMNIRIDQAKYYLLYTNYSISIIAQKLGFYDQNHFSSCFSKETGCSPSGFRKQNK